MANFNTHVTVAALGSGIVAVTLQSLGYLDAKAVLPCIMAGTLGGLLPDLDSDDPKALSMVLNIITGLAWIVLFGAVLKKVSLVEFGIIFIAITLLIKGGLFLLLQKYTSHRGNYHSVVGAVMTCFVVAAIVGRAVDGYTAWLIAAFCFFGFLTHLTLDELYRVNLVGDELEQPLFSAFKVASPNDVGVGATMVVIALVLWFFTPRSETFVDGYNQRAQLAENRVIRVWPEGNRLFGVNLPMIGDYYTFEVNPTRKGEDLQKDLGISEEDIETKRAKLDQIWYDFKAKVGSFQAQPKDQQLPNGATSM